MYYLVGSWLLNVVLRQMYLLNPYMVFWRFIGGYGLHRQNVRLIPRRLGAPVWEWIFVHKLW